MLAHLFHDWDPHRITPHSFPLQVSGYCHILILILLLTAQLGFTHTLTAKLDGQQQVSMARVYADVNALMPRAYWDYDSVNISWGLLENYEVVRKIGALSRPSLIGSH